MKKIDYILQHAPEVPLQKPLTYEQEKEIELMVELMITIDCDVCPAKDDCNEDSNSVECEDCWTRWMSQFAETPDELDLQFMTRTLLDCEAITCDNCPVYATNEDCDCDNRECGEIILNWMGCILYDAQETEENAGEPLQMSEPEKPSDPEPEEAPAESEPVSEKHKQAEALAATYFNRKKKHHGRPSKYDWDKITSMYKQGYPIVDISEACHCPQVTISARKSKHPEEFVRE